MTSRNQAAVRLAALAALALSAGGCTALDNLLASIPIFSFMEESPAFDPYEAPRTPPPNAVPFASPTGDLPPVTPPKGLTSERWLASLADSLENPYPRNAETVAAGQVQFQTYCAVCHGPTGTGNGPVTATGAYPRLIPSLVTPRARALSDEYIYGIIWAGRGLMPAYGGRVPDRDRWLIVNYVRQLQEAAGAQAQPAPPTGR
ncbi:MAG TPA: cytochrome c [Longimicrobiales bacterium]